MLLAVKALELMSFTYRLTTIGIVKISKRVLIFNARSSNSNRNEYLLLIFVTLGFKTVCVGLQLDSIQFSC